MGWQSVSSPELLEALPARQGASPHQQSSDYGCILQRVAIYHPILEGRIKEVIRILQQSAPEQSGQTFSPGKHLGDALILAPSGHTSTSNPSNLEGNFPSQKTSLSLSKRKPK